MRSNESGFYLLVRVKSDMVPWNYKTILRGKQSIKISTFRRNFIGFKRCRQRGVRAAAVKCAPLLCHHKKSLNLDKIPGHVGGQPVLSDEMEVTGKKGL